MSQIIPIRDLKNTMHKLIITKLKSNLWMYEKCQNKRLDDEMVTIIKFEKNNVNRLIREKAYIVV